jgi:uncharacterized protein (TIGR04255 family)
MGRKYRQPPLVEAICEFKFTKETKWDITIPGLVYEKIRDRFPKVEQRKFQHIEINQSPVDQTHQAEVRDFALFFTEDRKSLVQIGPRACSIHVFTPYPTWSAFQPTIEIIYNHLKSVLSESIGFERIGLRFVNKITISSVQKIQLKRFFEFRPSIGGGLPKDMDAFITGCIFSFFENQDKCKVQLVSGASELPNTMDFTLDLDYYLTQPDFINGDTAIGWVNRAHEQVEALFEGCITDELRRTFEEI